MPKFLSRIAELKKAPPALLALCVLGGLLGESLLLLEKQCLEISRLIKNDLRVAVFLDDGLSEGRRQVLEEKLRALPWVEETRYVPRAQALDELRGADPELVDSVAFLGDNPIPSSYELRPDPRALARLPGETEAARSLEGVAEVRYKPAQARAVLQIDFYAQLLRVVLDMAGLILAGLLVFTAWSAVAAGWHAHARLWAASGVLGTAAGMTLVLIFLLPARGAGLLHGRPDWSSQLICALAGVVAGLSLAQWRAKS